MDKILASLKEIGETSIAALFKSYLFDYQLLNFDWTDSDPDKLPDNKLPKAPLNIDMLQDALADFWLLEGERVFYYVITHLDKKIQQDKLISDYFLEGVQYDIGIKVFKNCQSGKIYQQNKDETKPVSVFSGSSNILLAKSPFELSNLANNDIFQKQYKLYIDKMYNQ